MPLKLTVLRGLTGIMVSFAGWPFLSAQTPGTNLDANCGPISIQSVAVEGRPVPIQSGDRVTLPASAQNILCHFGPVTNGPIKPIRLRYRMEGHDRNWHEGGGEMFLTVRFFDERGDQVSQQPFGVNGDSAGWKGSLINSSMTHRRETLTVPPRAAKVMTVISSAGPPATEGVYVVANLTLSKIERDKSAPLILIQPTFERQAGDDKPQPPKYWMRDGNHASMARIVTLGNDPAFGAFAIFDDDPISHAEWRSSVDHAPAVVAGDNLLVEWNEMYSMGVSDVRQATYAGLPVGNYIFHVEEVDIFGIPTGKDASLNVIVRPPIWGQPWFWSTIAVGLGLVIFGAGRYVTWNKLRREMAQLKGQQELERERLRIARDIHDDLGVRITRMALLTAKAEANPSYSDKARADFGRVSQLSREVVSALYQTVWAVNPENDHLDALGNYLCQIVNRLCEGSDLRCRFYLADLPKDVQISSVARNNISMAVKEAAHNVMKHARASELAVQVEFEAGLLKITVKDDGRGFELSGETSGNGLNNMNQRMESIGGNCSVESAPGKGTTVHLRLAIK